jgi:branched-chain amino acid transport system ATP-binding protein
MIMLTIDGLNIFFGKIQVLWDLSLNISEKEMVAVIGANASGKTTLLNAISGLVSPASGTVKFLEKRIDKMPAYRIELGAHVHTDQGEKAETLEWVYRIFPILKARAGQMARTLSGGERQMLAIGRGLMLKPKLCMLDEPSYALSPLVVSEVFNAVKELREMGTTILLVEQDIKRALQMADRTYLLENGKIVMEGTRDRFMQNGYIRKAYLGL